MFFPLHLSPPPYQEILYNQILDWCGNQEKLIYTSLNLANPLVSTDKSCSFAGLVERKLDEMELVTLKTYLHEIAETTVYPRKFGGFVIGQHLSDINSLAIFTLDSTGQVACLTLFITNATLKLATSPFQSPLLLLAIAALLQQEKTIEKLYLPFYEIYEEDFISLALYNLAPVSAAEHEQGWWQQANTQLTLTDLLHYPENETIVDKWLEISLEVEAVLVDYVRRLFSRYSYQQRFILEQQEIGSSKNAEEPPAILRAYLPVGEEAERRIQELKQKLAILSYLRPIAKLELVERDLAYWKNLWEIPNLFRINSNILLTPDRKNFIPAAGEILVEIPASTEVFASNEDGPHATTAFCLHLMAKYLNPLLHSNLLDLGTGGGTLAIVASYLGAKRIFAVDAFPKAIEIARANVDSNKVAAQVTVEAGSLGVLVKKDSLIYCFTPSAQQVPTDLAERLPFDMIMSNTFYHVLIGHAKALYAALRPGGLLISGGIFKQRATEVAIAFQKAGLELNEQVGDENWVSFVHSRPL